LGIPATLQDALMARLDRLGPGKQVVQLGATLGREFSYEVLQAVSPLDEAALQQGLWQLVEAELLYQRSLPPQATYLFKHALIQDTAYQSLLKSTRQQYHRQIAQTLEERFPDTKETQPELLAHHYTEAGLIGQAIPYWQQAGQRASQRSAHVEAIAFLNRGLALLQLLPDSADIMLQEVNLQLTLGNALNIAKGYTAPEVGRAYARARELCGQMEGIPQLVFALVGLFGFHLLRAELKIAEELAVEILRFAQAVQVPALLVGAHQALGGVLLWRGQFTAARTHLEQGLTFYRAEQRYPRGILHPGVVSFSYSGIALWSLGYPDQALARCYEGLTLAHEIDQPFSLAFAVQWTAALHLHRGEVQQAQEQVEQLEAISVDWAFSFWETVGTLLRGWLQVVQGRTEEGISQLRQAIATYQATGVVMLYPASLATLAEAYGKSGKPKEGVSVLTEALTVMNSTEQRHWEAELYRLYGELSLRNGEPETGRTGDKTPLSDSPIPRFPVSSPEEAFQKAIEVARKQQAKSLELRAVMSLSRLWQRQGKKAEARQILVEVYNWFTEGFDTKDLQEAKALLDGLGSSVSSP
jgi:predicted ATPase